MSRLLYVVLVTVLIACSIGAIAIAQDSPLAGLVQPLVINIEQAIPVDVTLALPQADGSVITTTAPITVGVALQIKIDGNQVIAVAPVAAAADVPAAEPAVTIAQPTAVAVAAPDELVFDSVRWQVDNAQNIGPVYDDEKDYFDALETKGAFIVIDFTVEDVGANPTQVGYGRSDDYDVLLEDGAGRRFNTYDGIYANGCNYLELNPGLPESCKLLFEVPVDAAGLNVVFSTKDGESLVPLGF